MTKDKEFVQLIDTMRKSVQKLGTKGAIDALKNAHNAKDGNAVMVNFIIERVVLEWGGLFSKNDFFKPNIRGEAVIARNMIFVLISKSLCLTPKEIREYVERCSDTTIRAAICYYHKLDKNNKYDKIIIDRHEKLFSQIANRDTNSIKKSKTKN